MSEDVESTVATPQVADVTCSCGGVMVPNPPNVWVCVDCERSAEVMWVWNDE